MGKTFKDKRSKDKSTWVKARISKKLKVSAKSKRKSLITETNPRVLKLAGADEWDFN
jgi:hypothetical protein